ncbi:MAG: LysE family translocator, partial [Boseongicola sp.]|nr:LysE family translocator [Boseongicola sp.]
MTETLMPFLLAVLALLIIPGPDMAFVMANGIAHGRHGAFHSALGISAGGLVLAVATALLVATTLAISPSVLLALQLAGCIYLLCIAARTIVRRPRPADIRAPAPTSGNLFLRGVATNVSNPKALTRPCSSSMSTSVFRNRETFQPFGTVSAIRPTSPRRCTGSGLKPHRSSSAGLRLSSRSRDSTEACWKTIPAITARHMAATGKSLRPA